MHNTLESDRRYCSISPCSFSFRSNNRFINSTTAREMNFEDNRNSSRMKTEFIGSKERGIIWVICTCLILFILFFLVTYSFLLVVYIVLWVFGAI
jgi:hypothetical protein